MWWSHHHPFKSGLTGETARQFCDAYTAATGKQWTQPIGFKHANLEVAIDVLKRTKSSSPPPFATRLSTPIISPWSVLLPGKAGPQSRTNACATPLVGGNGRKARSSSTTCTSFTINRRRISRSIAHSSQSNILDAFTGE